MTDSEYVELRKLYTPFSDDDMRRFLRQHAFEEFDAQVEAFCENGYELDMCNEGRSIMDITPDAVELIVCDYIERFLDEGQWFRDEMMRNAIQDVTGLIC